MAAGVVVVAVVVVVAELALPGIRYWVENIQRWDSLLREANSIRAARGEVVLHQHQTLVFG